MALPPPGDPRRAIDIAAIWMAEYACLLLVLPISLCGLIFYRLGGPLVPGLQDLPPAMLFIMLPGAFHAALAVMVYFQRCVSAASYLILLEAMLLPIGQWIVGIPVVIFGIFMGPMVVPAFLFLLGMELLRRLCMTISERLEDAERAMHLLQPTIRHGFDPILPPLEAQRCEVIATGADDAPSRTR